MEKFNLLDIKNDIGWHLDQIKEEYKTTLGDIVVKEVTEDKIVLECYTRSNLSDVEQSGMEDIFLDDYFNFLSKHHPEVKSNQIKLVTPVNSQEDIGVIEFYEHELQFIGTFLEMAFKDYYSKWDEESKINFRNILVKMEETNLYDMPKTLKKIILGDE